MRRITLEPRERWQERAEAQGCYFHTSDGQPYWDERACYAFDAKEIDEIERATYALDRMCLAAVERVITARRYDQFDISEACAALIAESWERDEQTVYGRFDLAYDGQGPPKLLEYNADTPTSLLEAAVIQWSWMCDVYPDADQFNDIHERLIEAWAAVAATVESPVHFACVSGNVEDYMTVSYLRDTAAQAGIETRFVAIEDVGWDARHQRFVGEGEEPIRCAFKLYPWEWMVREPFGAHLPYCGTRWLEAPWKMLLSNKAILVVLHEMFPDSPYLLPAGREPLARSYVRKPMLSREGANVRVVREGRTIAETGGEYGGGPYVYQGLRLLPEFEGNFPVVGSWMVNGHACGIGIREDVSPVTRNTSRFVPHVILPS